MFVSDEESEWESDINNSTTTTLPSSPSSSDINILLLGPSGAGKTLLINSIILYIQNETLEEAKEIPIEKLATIPTIISMCDSENNEYQTKLGEISQEEEDRIKEGRSVTRECKKYKIKFHSRVLTFIDTPGIGDTDLMDNKNFEHILSTISELKQLHAICIIMKPNENRMNVMFKYCINELLSYLHVSAKDNLFFCLSSTRSIHYRANGCPTKKLLDIQLDKIKKLRSIEIEIDKKIYCFDNESFNYLATLKSGGQFSSFEDSLMNISYSRSVQELTRLIKDIIQTKPHDIENTISINLARKMIQQLIQPIAICILNIGENLKLVEVQKNDIQTNLNLELDQLKLKLYTPFVNIKSILLDSRKTICTNQTCISNKELEKQVITQDGQIKYLNYCCNNCTSSNGEGLKSIYQCSSINLFGFCKNCKHHFTNHINIDTIEEREELQLILDPSIESTIKTKEHALLIANNLINDLESKINQYKSELLLLGTASIEFSCFLFKNSLIEYNDEIENYVELLINNEKNTSTSTNKYQSIENLQNYLNSHKKEIQQFKLNLEERKKQRELLILEKEKSRGIFYKLSQQELLDDEIELTNFDNNNLYGTSIKSAIEIKLKIDQILNLPFCGEIIKSKLKLFNSLNNININNNNIDTTNNNAIINIRPNSKRNSSMISRILSSLYNNNNSNSNNM